MPDNVRSGMIYLVDMQAAILYFHVRPMQLGFQNPSCLLHSAFSAMRKYACRADNKELAASVVAPSTVFDCCRDLPSTCSFDKVVSCEMVEAVGHEHLPAYFHAIGRVLKPGGKAAIQVTPHVARLHFR